MKLLLDHNLSHKLIHSLGGLFPDSRHVYQLGLDRATDREVFEYARDNNFIILTKDADFQDLNLFLSPPVKIIWLKTGNSDNQTIALKIIAYYDSIVAFYQDESIHTLKIY